MRLIDADELYKKAMKIINGNAGEKVCAVAWAVVYAITGAETVEAECVNPECGAETERGENNEQGH